jgi:hypothetical protein
MCDLFYQGDAGFILFVLVLSRLFPQSLLRVQISKNMKLLDSYLSHRIRIRIWLDMEN